MFLKNFKISEHGLSYKYLVTNDPNGMFFVPYTEITIIKIMTSPSTYIIKGLVIFP